MPRPAHQHRRCTHCVSSTGGGGGGGGVGGGGVEGWWGGGVGGTSQRHLSTGPGPSVAYPRGFKMPARRRGHQCAPQRPTIAKGRQRRVRPHSGYSAPVLER